MPLNQTTDYALRILIYLGQEKRVVPSSEMAKTIGRSQRYLLSVARKLKQHEYINVVFGPAGGYLLARPLDQIILHDVIVLMEGSTAVSHCMEQEGHCGEEKPCILHNMYSSLQAIVENYLRNLTVDMLINHPTGD